MMQLNTFTLETDKACEFKVLWSTGLKRFGSLLVRFSDDELYKDAVIAAELIAIRHLLFDVQVFSRTPTSAAGININVSKGAIKKFATGHSDKAHLKKFASFIMSNGRLANCKIEVVPAINQYLELAVPTEPEVLEVNQSTYRISEVVTTPVLGQVVLTHHAVERYIQKLRGNDSPKLPWVSLINRISNPELIQYKLSDKVLEHKRRKYGVDNQVEIWGHPQSSFRYVVVRDAANSIPVIATVFRREQGT